MKIGVLTTSYPQHAGDIAGCFVRSANRQLHQRGYAIETLVPETSSGETTPPQDGLTVRPVAYLRPRRLQRTFYGSGVLENLSRDPLAWPGALSFPLSLAAAVHRRGLGWDALISHWCLPCGLVGSRLAKGRPHLVVFHSGDVQLLERMPLRRQIAAQIAKGASALQFVAQHLRRRFIQLIAPQHRGTIEAKCFVCPMGIHIPAPTPRTPRSAADAALRVLTLSRLVPIKGLDDTIKACAQLSGAELTCAGAGPMVDELQSLAASLEVKSRFPGVLWGEAKSAAIRETDVFVLSSRPTTSGREEGCPTSLLEAMAAGLPIVATRTGGVQDVVQHEHSALLVRPGDSRALADALKRLQADPALASRLGAQARAQAEAYAWPRVVERMLERLSLPSRVGSGVSPKGSGRQRSMMGHYG